MFLLSNVRTMKKFLLLLLPFAAYASVSDMLGDYTPNDIPPPSPIQKVQSPCEIAPLSGNSVDIVADVEFLWWYSNVTNLSYGIKREVIPIESEVAPGSRILAPLATINTANTTLGTEFYTSTWFPGTGRFAGGI